MLNVRRFAAISVVIGGFVLHGLTIGFAQSPPAVEYYRLAQGFLAESFDASGMAVGTGFATSNPWGAYTAYRLATNAKGQRTWRIENYLPNVNAGTAQGSSMYLFEGRARGLLVDTAQNTADVPGQNDLKTVVRHLLSHNDDGSVRTSAVDFVVANTHSHGDHTGKNALMSDRAVYYPDLDWPRANAPANYVPIREGGGTTTNGGGQAVGTIDLGERVIEAVRLYAHTPGSTGYFDRENQMIATGDAIGSAYVWAHFGLVTQYADSVRHLQELLRPYPRIDVLPAHFYQVKQNARGRPPLSGRPLDKTYVDDQRRVAEGILDGSVVGEPYRVVGRNAAIATVGSAQTVYTLANLYPGGVFASTGDRAAYHGVAVPGGSRATTPAGPYAAVDRLQSRVWLIRDYANDTLYLVAGATRALLIGTGSGTPGVPAFVSRLVPGLPIDVAVTSDDPGQVGGLSQFVGSRLYLPAGVAAPAGATEVHRLGRLSRIDLGLDAGGRPFVFEAQTLGGHSAAGVTLVSVSDRILFSGDALGTQGNDAGLILRESLGAFADALSAWRRDTDGRYDVVYTAHNYQWFTSPAYVDQVHEAVTRGLSQGDSALVASTRLPGARMVRSTGGADIVATVILP